MNEQKKKRMLIACASILTTALECEAEYVAVPQGPVFAALNMRGYSFDDFAVAMAGLEKLELITRTAETFKLTALGREKARAIEAATAYASHKWAKS